MIDSNIESTAASGYERTARRKSKPSVIVFLAIWVFFIGAGVLGTIWYTNQLQAKITADLKRQTATQITAMQKDYQAQIEGLKTDYSSKMTALQGKVEALNELLTFTKDNANNKTDNSNKLYTQINEVKKQLDVLKKSLDVLK